MKMNSLTYCLWDIAVRAVTGVCGNFDLLYRVCQGFILEGLGANY